MSLLSSSFWWARLSVVSAASASTPAAANASPDRLTVLSRVQTSAAQFHPSSQSGRLRFGISSDPTPLGPLGDVHPSGTVPAKLPFLQAVALQRGPPRLLPAGLWRTAPRFAIRLVTLPAWRCQPPFVRFGLLAFRALARPAIGTGDLLSLLPAQRCAPALWTWRALGQ